VDLVKRQLTIQRSTWRRHVTAPEGGQVRYVPMTRRLVERLREHRHLRSPRVLGSSDGDGSPLTGASLATMFSGRSGAHGLPGVAPAVSTGSGIMPTAGLCRLLSATPRVAVEIARFQTRRSA